MARQLRWWIVVALGACAALALAYLPPRALPLFGQRFFRVFQSIEPPTPYRERAQHLADRYRSIAFELEMRRYRQAMWPELERRRAHEIAGPALYFAGPDSLSDSARGLVRALLETEWLRLGLGVTKISVGVVLSVVFERPRGASDTPSHLPTANAFLIPDSTDRSTCLSFVPIIYWGRPGTLKLARPTARPELAEQLRNGLGLCAYFAAFGTPGHAFGRWLAARRYDVASTPWGRRAPGDAVWREFGMDPQTPWFWSFVYRYQSNGVACMAGREAGCRLAVLGSGDGDRGARTVSAERSWWKPRPFAGADRYFADMVGEIGPERFGRMWNSELPVDTALTLALHEPVGRWTRRWQASLLQPISLGPAASAGAMTWAIVVGLAAVALVALTATRREVR